MRRQHNRNNYNHLTASFPGQPVRAGTRKVKPIWILLKQETVSGSGISWAIMQVCTSLQTDNRASTPPLSFLQAGCPSCRPTNSVKALKAQLQLHINTTKNISINTKRVCVEPPHLGCQHNATRRCSSGACGYRYAGAASCRCRSTGQTDGQTDGRTDGHPTVTKTLHCILCGQPQ